YGQTREITAIQWQIHDTLALDHLAQVRRLRLQDWRGTLHFDRLGDLADLKDHVHSYPVLHVDDDAGSNGLLEALGFHRHGVASHGDRCHHVIPTGVTSCFEFYSGSLVRDGHRSVWHKRTGLVGDRSHNGAGRRL